MNNENKDLVLSQNDLCRTCMSSTSNGISLYNPISILNKEEQLHNILQICTSIQVKLIIFY